MDKITNGEAIDQFTVSEVLKRWFEINDKRYEFFESLFEELLKLYFKNNKVVNETIVEIATLEKEFNHRCIVTQQAKEMFQGIPLPEKAIKKGLEIIRKHVEENND